MKENSNSILIANTIVLYIRLAFILICGLASTRFALKALGESDFGLFSIVGSIVIVINIVNSTMTSTCNRFLSAAIGKGQHYEKICKVFNINLAIQIAIALITLIIALPSGSYYITHYINYNGSSTNASMVFYISVIASAISFIGVPYNSLLLAKERFYVFCLSDIFFWTLRAFLCYLLMFHFEDKLLAYAFIAASTTVMPVLTNYSYCKICFPSIIQLKVVKGWHNYAEVFSFSAWVGYGAVVQIGREQSIPIFLNLFFNTIINAAYAVSNQVKVGISMFASNLSKPISPQITKNYVSGNLERCTLLMISSSKLSFMFMLIVSSPFLACPDYILSLWLYKVPDYSITFMRLMIIDSLINTLNMGIAEYVFASGNIRSYQFWTNTIYVISILVTFVFLLFSTSVYAVLYIAICASIVTVAIRQFILHKTFNFNNMALVKGSYLPSLTIFLLFLPTLLMKSFIPPVCCIIIIPLYVTLLVYRIGISEHEKKAIAKSVNKYLCKAS